MAGVHFGPAPDTPVVKILWQMPVLRRDTCGLSLRAVKLATGLVNHGHGVEFCVSEDRTDLPAAEVEGIPVRLLPSERGRAAHWSLQSRSRVCAARAQVEYIGAAMREFDVVVSCQPEFVAACPRRPETPPVAFVCGGTTLLHDESQRREQSAERLWTRLAFAIDRALKHRHERAAFAAADLVVFDSAATRNRVVSGYRLSATRMHVVHGGADPLEFQPATDDLRCAARRLFGVPSSAVVVAWTGRLSPEKNLDLLIRAFACLAVPRPVLLIAGDGLLGDSLADLARRLGLEDCVRFLGRLADVRPVLHAADIYAFPSRGESFGGALVEAMACGLPCVALRGGAGGVRNAADEIIEQDRSGLLVDEPTPQIMASAIAGLAGDAARRDRLGRAARQRAARDFNWTSGACRLAGLLAGLVDSRSFRRMELPDAAESVGPAVSAPRA